MKTRQLFTITSGVLIALSISVLGTVATAQVARATFSEVVLPHGQRTVPPTAAPGSSVAPLAMPYTSNSEPAHAPSNVPAPSYTQSMEPNWMAMQARIDALEGAMKTKSDKADDSHHFGQPKISGRVFMDSVNVASQNKDSETIGHKGQNSLGFGEARIGLTGVGYGFLDYKLELGFEHSGAQNNVLYKDIFLGINYVPVLQYVRLGHYYVEDGGSEVCVGTTCYTFMKAPQSAGGAFTSRRLGISSRQLYCNDRLRIFSGVFGAREVTSTHTNLADNQGVIFNARATYAPYFTEEGRCMFLFGGYYNYTAESRNVKLEDYVTKIYPGGFKNEFYALPTGDVYCTDYQKAGAEFVYQYSQFTLQGEAYLQYLDNFQGGNYGHGVVLPSGDKTVYGGFLMARLFLTPGDFRTYDLKSAAWSYPHVTCPFSLFGNGCYTGARGYGAWEVALMYGFKDNSDLLPGGTLFDNEVGVALNWYWNPQLKWGLNYIHQFSDIKADGHTYNPQSDIVGLTCRYNF